MEQIQESIKEKLLAEQKQKDALSSAQEIFKAHMKLSKEKRIKEWKDK
jgi:hypothetical protein